MRKIVKTYFWDTSVIHVVCIFDAFSSLNFTMIKFAKRFSGQRLKRCNNKSR